MARIFLLLWVLMLAPHVAAENIKLYTYHLQPPFVIGDQRDQHGLMFALGGLLNRNAEPGMRFEPVLRPRPRLNRELKHWINGECPGSSLSCANNWMVFWVTPVWGWGDDAQHRFRWVELFADEDLIISRDSNRVDYQEPGSLIGQRFAAMRGNYYPQGLEELMQQGRVERLDGDSWRSVLLRVSRARADVTLIQRSAFDYYVAHDDEVGRVHKQLYIASKPFKSFTLQVMIPADRPDLQQFLQRLKSAAAWRELFNGYGIEPL